MGKKLGFTIVELLIVIVVIAVLATISIVAYRGIQQRANNSSRVADARQMANLLRVYRAQVGVYPAITNGANSVCLGNGFVNLNADIDPDCWDANMNDSNVKHTDPTFNADLQSVGVSSVGNRKPIINGVYKYVGPVYSTPSETNNVTNTYVVRYWLEGVTTCIIGSVLATYSTAGVQCGIGLD